MQITGSRIKELGFKPAAWWGKAIAAALETEDAETTRLRGRVDELLRANNGYLEDARAARRKVAVATTALGIAKEFILGEIDREIWARQPDATRRAEGCVDAIEAALAETQNAAPAP